MKIENLKLNGNVIESGEITVDAKIAPNAQAKKAGAQIAYKIKFDLSGTTVEQLTEKAIATLTIDFARTQRPLGADYMAKHTNPTVNVAEMLTNTKRGGGFKSQRDTLEAFISKLTDEERAELLAHPEKLGAVLDNYFPKKDK